MESGNKDLDKVERYGSYKIYIVDSSEVSRHCTILGVKVGAQN